VRGVSGSTERPEGMAILRFNIILRKRRGQGRCRSAVDLISSDPARVLPSRAFSGCTTGRCDRNADFATVWITHIGQVGGRARRATCQSDREAARQSGGRTKAIASSPSSHAYRRRTLETSLQSARVVDRSHLGAARFHGARFCDLRFFCKIVGPPLLSARPYGQTRARSPWLLGARLTVPNGR
jgi:hypothetical protein